MDNPEEFIFRDLRERNIIQIKLPERNELLSTLFGIRNIITGRFDLMFCNSFLSEAVQLLINSVFLYEMGYFDCAFYSIRQSSETANNMVYLATNKDELEKWKNKERYPTNAQVIKKLKALNNNYREIKNVLSDFFNNHEKMIANTNKIIHKQGYNTFYASRTQQNDFKKETKMFSDLLIMNIGIILILYIAIDPFSLILADGDLNLRINFNPITEPVDVEFFHNYLSDDIIERLKRTKFFTELSNQIKNKKKMNPFVYSVIRNRFFSLENLDKIESQKQLLSIEQIIILDILKKKVKISHIFVDCNMLYFYFTSITNNFKRTKWSSEECNNCENSKEILNKPYENIFQSIVNIMGNNWMFEHNSPLSKREIDDLMSIVKDYNKQYEYLKRLIEENLKKETQKANETPKNF